MNGFRPSVGVTFDDNYTEAKNKLIDFIMSLNKLTPAQREQLAIELMESTGMTALLESFINYMNYGGRL